MQFDGMAKDIRQMRADTGEDPQWTGGMFGGMPAYLIDVSYPAQLVKNTVGRIIRIVDTPTGFLFFAMTAMWVMLLLCGVDPWVAIVGALAYGLSTYFLLIIAAGHVTKMWALVYAPLMMGGAWVTLRGNIWFGGVLTALAASLEIGANHPRKSPYYFLMAMAAFWLSGGIIAGREKRLRSFARRTAVLAAAECWPSDRISLRCGTPPSIRRIRCAVGRNWQRRPKPCVRVGARLCYGVELWPCREFQSVDSRFHGARIGVDLCARWPYGCRAERLRLARCGAAVAHLLGRTTLHRRSDLFGAAAVFLAALGIALLRGRNKWWMLAVCVVMLLFSRGGAT